METEKLLRPFSEEEVIERYQEQTGHLVIEALPMRYNRTPQTFLILEWMNDREYCVRRLYVHLTLYNGKVQPIGQGSGHYPLLFDKIKDFGAAIDYLHKMVEYLVEERGEEFL